ncbi:MAG: aldose 1-epimerase [Flavobacteriales bacterium]
MYKIEHKLFGALKELRLVNTATAEYVSVIPGLAATINGLVLQKDGKAYELINGCSTYQDLMTEGKRVFKGTKLFPFPNRINQSKYSFAGKDYTLKMNFPAEGHAIHGLVCEKAFEVLKEKADENQALLKVQYQYNGEDSGYPFKYKLTVEYTLSAKGFACNTTIENTDKTDIPVGDGWHPYFKIGTQLNQLSVKIPSNQVVEVDEKMIPNGSITRSDDFVTATKINSAHFDTCYQLEAKEGRQKVELFDEQQDIGIAVWQDTGKNKYNYVQIYTPPSRDCIAIEPMTCMPDAFNNKKGLILLKPGEIVNLAFGVELTIKIF